tara:strand:+ start:17722 stop:18738 length:1017 start_codon:yes stop_codon:yes gene_type:complete
VALLSLWVTAITVLSFVAARLVRRYALRQNLLDIPGARSSHVAPTPRGGGFAIVVAFYAGIAAAAFAGAVSWDICMVLAAGLVVAGAGFADDHHRLSVRLRLLVHFAAALWVALWLGGWPDIDLGFAVLHWGIMGSVVSVFGLVWLTNLFNFMDGTDGVAAAEAVFVAATIATLVSGGGSVALAALALAAGALGFLILNWPPASLFMGDVGSGFLGFVLGALALAAITTQTLSPLVCLILVAGFATDATITLTRRLWRGDNIWLAHRSHAYQHAAQRFGSHKPVLVASIALNFLWLLPCAVLALWFPSLAALVTVIAYLPVIALVLHFDAGKAEASIV